MGTRATGKNGGTITTFANWMISHASEPALSDARLSPGGEDLVNVTSPVEAVVAPLSRFPVGEASLAAIESSVTVLEPVQHQESQGTRPGLPPVP